MAVLALLTIVGGVVGHAAASAGPRVAVRHVTVRPGETLWALAARIEPQSDPRVVVAQLEAINHLRSDGVAAGQRLAVSGLSG
jgi:LysM repeat protein